MTTFGRWIMVISSCQSGVLYFSPELLLSDSGQSYGEIKRERKREREKERRELVFGGYFEVVEHLTNDDKESIKGEAS